MRLSTRLNLSLVIVVAMVSLALAFYQTRSADRGLRRDLNRHSLELAESLERSAEPLVVNPSYCQLQALVDRFLNHQGLAGVVVYNARNQTLAVTSDLAGRLAGIPPAAARAMRQDEAVSEFFHLAGEPMHVVAQPIRSHGRTVGALAILHDAAYIDRQAAAMWWRVLAGVAMQAVLIVAVTLLVLRWRLGIPLARFAQWLHDLRTGGAPADPGLPEETVFGPIKHEVTRLARTLTEARAAAGEEARLRNAAESLWTPERLCISVRSKLNGSRLFAVSNREPYEHFRRGNTLEWSVPASGLVTALDPILQACAGTWIAQGTGDADRAAVDGHDRLLVPPDDPHYTLRRVWLTREEEQGFYFGFANEGLWPLCHLAHTPPVFRAQDWDEYYKVNQRFANALIEEAAGEEHPVILVQDYHFALVPRMIKRARPDARVAIFWHIPWPNPEAFGICPWRRELLDGLLGADLIGFHIQSHCNNFLESVDRAIQSRIDREHFAVSRSEHLTYVRPFPISVAFTNGAAESPANESCYEERARLLGNLGVKANMLGIGVDRVDYTKGLPERFVGLEKFFEKHPVYRGQFTFVQIGAPSRTHIRRYQDLMEQLRAEVERINRRFQTSDWKPIVFLPQHHSHEQILPYYRNADLCLVTSLHDGMNLVSKEYVAAQSNQSGVLILSRFAGASHELVDSLLVNPYDADELAGAIHTGLEMGPEERSARMARMRAYVREHNIYRWAGNLIAELAELRLDSREQLEAVTSAK